MLTKQMFNNCIDVEINDGVYYPVRFSPKQFEFYRNHSEFVHIRALCTADIYFEFSTASETVSFSCTLDNFVRKFSSFDIYENDEFIENIPFPGCPETVEILYNKRRPGISKISVYLPYHCRAGISNLNAEITPVSETSAKKLKILAYGDSITQGMFAEYPSFTYPSLISKHFNAGLINQGVGGMPFKKDSLDAELNYKPDIITVAFGTIDLSETSNYDEIITDMREYIRELKRISGKSRVYIISTLNSPTLKLRLEKRNILNREEWFKPFSDELKDACEETGLNFINGSYLAPNLPEFYVSDGHPNAQGFLTYALNLVKHINTNKRNV